MSSRGTRLVAAWSLGVALGCNGVGRPLIDREPPAKLGKFGMPECSDVAVCEDDSVPLPEPAGLRKVEPVALDRCGATIASCDMQQPDPTHGDTQRVKACTLQVEQVAKATLALSQRRFECTSLHLDLGDEGGVLAIDQLQVIASNLSVTSKVPLSIIFTRSLFDDVWFEVDGPISLHFDDTDDLASTRLVLGGADSASSIELRESRATFLTVSTADERHEGSLRATRMALSGAQIQASSVTLESVYAEHTAIIAERLQVADADFYDAAIEANQAVISAATLNASYLAACGETTLAGSTVQSSRLVSCESGQLRVYGSTVVDSAVDGSVQGDQARFLRTRFGAFETTEVTGWDSKVSHSNFCEHSTALRFGGGESQIDCSACDGRKQHALSCDINEGPERDGPQTRLVKNDCPTLQMLDHCDNPLPERERPIAM